VIEESVISRVLGAALRTGGDFAEIFAEDRRGTMARLDDGKVEDMASGRERGAGIRVVAGDTTGFAHTSDLSETGLRAAPGGGGARPPPGRWGHTPGGAKPGGGARPQRGDRSS
jgi:TldD protein